MSEEPKALPWIMPERCEGCASCINACRCGLLSMIETSEGVFVPWLDRPDKCTGCGACEAACPWSAIYLTSYVEDARRRLLINRPEGMTVTA